MKSIDEAAKQLCELMIEKIKGMQDDWRKPWFTRQTVECKFYPCNLSSRRYSGGNILTLLAVCEKFKYRTPVFLTLKRAEQTNARVLKNEKPFPVFFYTFLYFHKRTNKNVSREYYLSLGKESRKQYREVYLLRYYNVFNLDQTNFREVHPAKWEKILEQYTPKERPEIPADPVAYKNAVLDTMLENDQWVCPIYLKEQNRAFYAPFLDSITLPLKKQFHEGEAFYGTMLHEMGHSTGHETRLKREISNPFGSEKYAREELVAEFTSALCGLFLGIPVTLQNNNAAYLKDWLHKFNNDPKYLLNVLSDCTKATKFICLHLGINEEKREDNIAA